MNLSCNNSKRIIKSKKFYITNKKQNDIPNDNTYFYNKKNINIKNHKSTSLNKLKIKNSKSISISRNLNKIRRDIYGNIIEKGGNQKISFRDDLKGKPLVETTIIDLKKNVIQKQKIHRKKNGKETIIEESKDKEEIICSSACYIF